MTLRTTLGSLALAIAVVACGGADSGTAQDTTPAPDDQLAADADGDQDEPASQDEDSGDDAASAVDRSDLPDRFPAEMWLPPGTRILDAGEDEEDDGVWLTGRVRGDDVDALAADYEAELVAAGWDILGSSPVGDVGLDLRVQGFGFIGFVGLREPPPHSTTMVLFIELQDN